MHVNSFPSRAHRRVSLIAGVAAAAITLAACGGDPAPIAEPAATTTVASTPVPTDPPATDPTAPATTPGTTPETAPPAPKDAAVKISQTELGDVLANPDGKTLYAFTNDVEAKSTCYGTCAEAWPPVIVDADFIVSPGLDSGIFATTTRDDGSTQLVAGKFPLYLFAADAKSGDITGHGSGDVWFAVDLNGRIIDGTAEAVTEEAVATPTIQLAESALGTIVTDAAGMTLYLFTADEAGSPTCAGGCAGAWPPLLVENADALFAGEGIDPALLSTVEHPDGGIQVKIGKWPLYYFGGDVAAGETNGQGSGEKWFVVGADAKSIK